MKDKALKQFIKEMGLRPGLYHQITVYWHKWCFQSELGDIKIE